MSLYLPDSTHMIGYSRGHRVEREWFQRVLNGGETVGSCEVVIGECYSGAHPDEHPGWREIFNALRLWSISPDDAVRAGAWRYQFGRRGIPLSMTDTLIAAVAHRVGATIITDNLKDFPMDGISVVSLARPTA